MKKTISAIILLFAAMAPAMAQTDETFQFVDRNGSVVPNGTTVTVSELTEDEFLGNNINSGLQVKNASDASAYVRVVYDITRLDNGQLQVCFPVTCNTQYATGVYETTPGSMNPGDVTDLQSEWFPTVFGQCTVTYRLEVMTQVGVFPRQSFEKIADGPTVTVVFNYADPAGIAATRSDATAKSQDTFDLTGRRTARLPWRGLAIVNGRKVLRK